MCASHPASTPIALPQTGAGPVVDAPCGAVRGVWRRIASAPADGADDGTGANGPGTSVADATSAASARFTRSAAFYGIPFAEPPVDSLRFLAPVPRGRWDGVREATRPGPTPQRRPFGETTAIPEPSIPGDDILSVNVFTPAPGDAGAHLPVLVWIHGGGFYAGSPASPYYDGAAFNRDGVVTVSVSYRLGLDGFGWIPDSDAPVNRGILDQILALEWVRENIAAFGGDPEQVTIGGQSAGGASALVLLNSPRVRGLFSRVICESGGTTAATVTDAASSGSGPPRSPASPRAWTAGARWMPSRCWTCRNSSAGSSPCSTSPPTCRASSARPGRSPAPSCRWSTATSSPLPPWIRPERPRAPPYPYCAAGCGTRSPRSVARSPQR
ncbi:carboxylesterase family protein [Actinomyces ruminis]|uniref:Carboxylic ester hydrolase n=1 Tax=Actinomyces ruminis TaxID=1937003 RepID=A0ABX4MDG2_9ACTO|nr:carboxylesterase family protein [Actinomyces ruminis]PHP53534.1 hypothetical protein BW737_002025 [Actinomyces ruminis]